MLPFCTSSSESRVRRTSLWSLFATGFMTAFANSMCITCTMLMASGCGPLPPAEETSAKEPAMASAEGGTGKSVAPIRTEHRPLVPAPAKGSLAGAVRAESPLQPHLVAASKPPLVEPRSNGVRFGLRRSDVDVIAKSMTNLQLVVPVREVRREVRYGEQMAELQVIGTVEEYVQLHSLPVAHGRFLTKEDDEQLRNVAVISERIARTLFRGDEPIGKSIRIGGHYFLVLGTIDATRDGREGFPEFSDHVYVPLATMRSRLGDHELVRASGAFQLNLFELSRIEWTVQNSADLQTAAMTLERLLKSLHDDGSFSVSLSVEKSRGNNK